MKSALLCDARWKGPHGIGRFAQEVLARLPGRTELERGPKPLSAADPLWLAWQVRRRRPSVYFSPGFNPPPACPVPFVFTIHDLLQILLPEVATPLKRLYYASVVKPACRRAFRVLTVSEYSRARILEWSGIAEDRVINAGNGVGPPFCPEGGRYEPGFRYVLYGGNFRPHKNLGRLLEAFRDLEDRHVRLMLLGVPNAAVLQSLDRYGLRYRTAFAGVVSDAALARLYRGAAALVLPSLVEGFGLPALEAMACGTPVVASNASSLPEVVGAAAIPVDPLDVQSIRRGLDRVLGDAALCANLRQLGIERARLFSWDAVAARVGAVLSEAGWSPQKLIWS